MPRSMLLRKLFLGKIMPWLLKMQQMKVKVYTSVTGIRKTKKPDMAL